MLFTVPEINLCPLGHSYSIPMNNLAVIPISIPLRWGLKLALFIAFSAKVGNFVCRALKLTFFKGTSHGCKTLVPFKNPGWLTPEEWEYIVDVPKWVNAHEGNVGKDS